VQAFLKLISKLLAGFACLVLLGIMAVTFVDVVGRYFFNAPVTFAVELIQLGMGLLVMFGLAITTLERGHIAVDIVENLVTGPAAKLFAAIAALCGMAFIALIAWRLWDRALAFLDDGLSTDVLFLPVWPVVMLMAIAASFAALVAAVQVLRPNMERND
jgi:TRAP-type C4-dicarboxylate transport system permease small subunit